MPTLYKTNCNTDWKGRPSHMLEVLGTGTHEELLAKMDEDVREWQADDIQIDQEAENEDAEAEERDPTPVSSVWHQEGVRWEMSRKDTNEPREFASRDGEGGFWSLVYHILD